MNLIKPDVKPPLDPDFHPAVLANHAFLQMVEASGKAVPLIIGLERADGHLSRFETRVFAKDHPYAAANLFYVERLVKFLLWQRGGWKIYVGGPRRIGEQIKAYYTADGERHFDYRFMGETVYEKEFTVVPRAPEDVPAANESGRALGRHLDGYRIGFDLGASDRKVSAVINGQPVYSEEVIWQPGQESDPQYHFNEILAALNSARNKLSRLDAIGGSSAGIFINNRPMVASIFRSIPPERDAEIKSLFLRLRDRFKVPLEVINDGDVTALAGAMSLQDNAVLGIAMGSSEAAGYVDRQGRITGWLNELAFAPVDYNPNAPVDEWSGDRGVGAQYFSQQAVFRLASKVGITIPKDISDAEKLKYVQQHLESGDTGATQIWQSIGIYLGYAIAHYSDFYDLKHVLVLGRVTSGRGGSIIIEKAKQVLQTEFPDLYANINIQLPDETSRRVGQAIAAASLPALD